jgi:hypothetical protein
MQTRYVNLQSSAGGDGTTNNTSGSTRAFATLRAALDSLAATLTEAYTIYCSGTGGDSGDVDQDPFDFTTSATNYLLITTQGADRHAGVWDSGKYYIVATNRNGLYNNSSCHVRIDGIQVQVTVNDDGDYIGIKLGNANQTAADIDLRATNCIVKGIQTLGSIIGLHARPFGGGGAGKSVFANCMAIDCGQGGEADTTSVYYYNCGFYGGDYGLIADAAFVAKNCLVYNAANNGYVGSFNAASTNNASTDATCPGSNKRNSKTFTFVDAGAKDFHLAGGDVGARTLGADLSGDGTYSFSTDIDGDTRSGSWDIGPDQYLTVPSRAPDPFMVTGVSGMTASNY